MGTLSLYYRCLSKPRAQLPVPELGFQKSPVQFRHLKQCQILKWAWLLWLPSRLMKIFWVLRLFKTLGISFRCLNKSCDLHKIWPLNNSFIFHAFSSSQDSQERHRYPPFIFYNLQKNWTVSHSSHWLCWQPLGPQYFWKSKCLWINLGRNLAAYPQFLKCCP